MTISNDEAQKLVLAPARLDELQGRGYCVGPYGDKVGFAFQQRRALNIIWAANAKDCVKRGGSVAILGGGLAGATACVGLVGMGHMAQIFESRDRVLKLQLQAYHRVLHPCYNSWPMANEFSSSTNNPFLNWYVGNAEDVLKTLYSEWDELYQPELPEPKTLCTITDVKLSEPDNNRVVISYNEKQKDGSVRHHVQEFDAAIIALGFGQERDLDLSDEVSYWMPDRLDGCREDEEMESFCVSGIGDGGLIDCLRLIHKNIDGGKLLVRVIAMLRHNKYAHPPLETGEPDQFELSALEDRIRQLERSVEDKYQSHDPDRGLNSSQFGTAIQNEIASSLEKGYREIAAVIPYRCKRMLDESLSRPERVTLIGNLVAPFSPTTAPINKLLIAHALNKYPELYKQGRVDRRDGKPIIRRPDGSWDFITADHKILRHGTNAPIKTLFETFDIELARKTHTLSSVIDVELPTGAFSDYLPNVVHDRPEKEEYLNARLPKAISFGRNVLRSEVEPDWNRETKTGRFVVVKNEGYLSSMERTGGFDRMLFGVPIICEDEGEYQPAVKRQA